MDKSDVINEPDKVTRFPDVKRLEAQAAEWLIRLDDEGCSPDDYAEFEKWRTRSDHHREIFNRLAADWKGFDRLSDLNDYTALIDHSTIAEFEVKVSRRRFLITLAASIAMAFGVGALYNSFFWGKPDVFQTAVGERKRIELPDSTIIELNTNSLVHAVYSKSTREIRLLKGEAYFEVTHDPSRPLSVFAGQGIVEVLGTAFTVRMRNDEKIDVLVSEGNVALGVLDSVTPDGIKPLTKIQAGQDVVLHREEIEHLRDLDLEEIARKLSWRNGILSFRGESLADVVADMSRYADVRIEIDDEDLRRLTVDGYFRVGEIETMIEALKVMADLEVEQVNPNYFRLTKRQKG